ncbi:putative DNA-J protein [Trypanosoma theileri]|uniref:Putative DNA-J protein n=1 Tax=Trypanosoma theileri TaxID=67003 RepID=A0A1X0P1T7_9TRYP|nr:putative DNA-J protein [Trypanosoma theileri]ORC90897.1 putative DNA-J protein [Trypanosoma theileri]
MYYRTLGVKRRASSDDIRKAFHTLAVRLHPDKPGGSVELFQALQKAYEILSDAKTRATYDEELEKRRSKLRGFKRPAEFESVRFPVHFKLADDEYYTFETAPDKLKCTFKHGDIITWNSQIGCFIGLAADNYLYWCRDGNTYASQLCQKESFGVDTVKVVYRANFKTQQRRHLPSSLKKKPTVSRNSTTTTTAAAAAAAQEAETTTAEASSSSAAATMGESTTTDTTSHAAENVMKGRRAVLSEAERLRRDIMRRERERYVKEQLELLVECEKKKRVRLMEKINAVLEDRRQEFKDWIAAGKNAGTADKEEEPVWITYAKEKERIAGETDEKKCE